MVTTGLPTFDKERAETNGTVVSKLLRLSGLCKELLNAVGGQRVRTMLFCWDDDDWCLRDAGAQLEHESPQAICCQAEMS